jgi:hypothetical protein
LFSSVKKRIAKINQEKQEEKFTSLSFQVYMWSNKRITKCNEKTPEIKNYNPFAYLHFNMQKQRKESVVKIMYFPRK